MYLARAASELGALPSLLGRDGIAIVPNIYSPAEIAALNAAMDPVFAAKTAEARAYVWPDQTERLARLTGALTLALTQANPIRPEQANATDFLRARLAVPVPGAATVLYHSIMWNYVSAADRAEITQIVEAAGDRADAGAPLAWLRFEIPGADALPTLLLTQWPGGVTAQLATAHPHGAAIAWQG